MPTPKTKKVPHPPQTYQTWCYCKSCEDFWQNREVKEAKFKIKTIEVKDFPLKNSKKTNTLIK